MALSFSRVAGADTTWGNKKVKVRDVTLGTYADNGVALVPNDVGLRTIDNVLGTTARKTDGTLAVDVSYDHANQKLLAYWGDNNNAADAPAIEVADTTDLSTYVARLTFIGSGA